MKQSKKRGFTIIELVIVIAVIAILAAVLIPTFASLIKKAKMSVDQQTVTNVNIILQAEEVDGKGPTTVDEVNKILKENGYRIPMAPTADGYAFYWIKAENRIVLVEMDGDSPKAIIYPTNLQKYNDNIETLAEDTDWFLLAKSEEESGGGTPPTPVDPEPEDIKTEIPEEYKEKAIWVYEEDSFTIENEGKPGATIKYNNPKTITVEDVKYKNPEMPDFLSNTLGEALSKYEESEGKVCIRLNQTVSESSVQYISTENLTIDLNGYEIYRNNGTSSNLIHMNSCILNIFDSSEAQSGKIKGINETAASSSFGFIEVSGTLNLYSGTLTAGNAAQGGAVYMSGEGNEFNMYGGTITNCKATNTGGGVEVLGKSTFNMSGGTISGNTATSGGAVYVSGSTFNMSGGEISGNHASKNGCGVYIWSDTYGGTTSFTMSGGKIINNSSSGSASVNGGGVYFEGSKQNIITFTMTGGEIKGNSATEGGGIYLQKGVTFNYEVAGGPKDNISGNTGGQVSKNEENSGSIGIVDWTE